MPEMQLIRSFQDFKAVEFVMQPLRWHSFDCDDIGAK